MIRLPIPVIIAFLRRSVVAVMVAFHAVSVIMSMSPSLFLVMIGLFVATAIGFLP